MTRHLHGRTLLVVIGVAVVLVWWRSKTSELELQGLGKGFVITLAYTGQVAAGLRALRSQQCWISSFKLPLVIVEPFLRNSTLHNSYQLWSQHSENGENIPFRDVFDLNDFNKNSQSSGNPVLVSWDNFYIFAPRMVVLLTIGNVHHSRCLQFTKEMCSWDVEEGNQFSPCNIAGEIQQVVFSLQRQNFVVVRNVCLNCLEGFPKVPPSAITNYIFGPYDAHDVTLIINKWRFSFKLTSDCKGTCIHDKAVMPENYIESLRVKKDTQFYLEKFLPSEKFVSVMIRMEWYFIAHRKEKDNNDFAVKCLAEVLEEVAQFQSHLGNSVDTHPFLTMDIGAYGSTTFEGTLKHTNISISAYNEVVNHTKNFVTELYRGSWTFSDWEKSFLTIPGVLGEKGYIAAVQRSIASKGACLILMGGGHFQHMVLQAYLKLRPDKTEQCVKFVCMAPSFQRLFTSSISSP